MQVDAAPCSSDPLDLFLTALVAAALVWLAVDLIEGRRLARPRARLLAGRRGRAGGGRLPRRGRARCGAPLGVLPASFSRSSPHDASICCTSRCIRSMPRGLVSRSGWSCSMRPSSGRRPPSSACRRCCGGCRDGRLPAVAAASWAARRAGRSSMAAGARDPSIPIAAARDCACRRRRLCAVAATTSRPGAPGIAVHAHWRACFSRFSCPPSRCTPRSPRLRFRPRSGSSRTSTAPQVIEHARRPAAAPVAVRSSRSTQLPTSSRSSSRRRRTKTRANRAFVVWSSDRAREISGDVRRRALRARWSAPEPLRADSSRSTARRRIARPGCDWDLSDDVSPPRARAPARTSRTCCAPAGASASTAGRSAASIVRAMLDYRTLPFIASRSPVSRVAAAGSPGVRPKACPAATSSSCSTDGAALRCSPRARASGRFPMRPSSGWWRRATPFWADVDRGNERFRVYFLNDRGGIYALGYPVITRVRPSDQPGGARDAGARAVRRCSSPAPRCSTRSFSRTPASGRALLREIRSSFYRKLFGWRLSPDRSCRSSSWRSPRARTSPTS